MSLEPKEAALLAAQLANERKAHAVTILEVGKISVIADYFVICSGASTTQVHAICDHLEQKLKEKGLTLLGREGYRQARWILLDYGFLVVHIFQEEEREFYNLERLWSNAPAIPAAGS